MTAGGATGRREFLCVGHAAKPLRWLLALGITIAACLAPMMAAADSGISLKADLGLLTSGAEYNGTISASGPLSGCYQFVALGLPAGLSLRPASVCAAAGATSIESSVVGRPILPRGLATALDLTIRLVPIPSATAPPAPGAEPVAELKTAMLPQPADWTTGPPRDSYAGTSLAFVSCPEVATCWVFGSSGNAPSPVQGLPVEGEPRRTMLIPHPARPGAFLDVLAGGSFFGRIAQLTPLRLDVARTSMSGSWRGMSCPAPKACILAGALPDSAHPDGQPALLRTFDGGVTWSTVIAPVPPGYTTGTFSALSCIGSACTMVGRVDGNGKHAAVSARSSVDRRDHVLTLVPIDDSIARDLNSVSCTQGGTCVAVGTSGGGVTGSARVVVADRSNTWRIENVADDKAQQPWMDTVDGPLTFGTLSAVACAPDSNGRACAALWPFWWRLTNTSDGAHWLPDVVTQAPYGLPGAPGEHLACAPGGRCFGLGNPSASSVYCLDNHCTFVSIMESIPSGAAWNWGIAGIGPSDLTFPTLKDISCPTATSCVAVGSWKPKQKQAWSPLYPLVMTPEHAKDPFFSPPPPPASIISWDTVGLLLGVVSTIAGTAVMAEAAPELAILSLLAGAASTAIGIHQGAQGDALGYASLAMGLWGLFSTAFGLPALLTLDVATTSLSALQPSTAAPPPPLPVPDWLKDPLYSGGLDVPD